VSVWVCVCVSIQNSEELMLIYGQVAQKVTFLAISLYFVDNVVFLWVLVFQDENDEAYVESEKSKDSDRFSLLFFLQQKI
jgi:hypothetical protein